VIWSTSLYFHSFNNNKILICKNPHHSVHLYQSSSLLPCGPSQFNISIFIPVQWTNSSWNIYICLEAAQEISLYSYLHLKLAKTSCFSFYLLWFLFYKIREQVGWTGSAQWERGWWPQWEMRGDRERDRRMNMMWTMYTHVYKCKNNDSCWNCFRSRGGVMKESNDGSEFKYNIYDTLQQPL
jgi:hypothetical protein